MLGLYLLSNITIDVKYLLATKIPCLLVLTFLTCPLLWWLDHYLFIGCTKVQRTDHLHPHPQHRIRNISMWGHTTGLTLRAYTHLQTPTCACRGIPGGVERLRSILRQVSIHTVAFEAPMSVDTPSSMPAQARNFTLIYVLRPTPDTRKRKIEGTL